MNKKIIGIFICMLLVGTVLPVSGTSLIDKTTTCNVSGNTLYVGGTGEGNYTKIQDAIDNASDGDTVFVYDDSSPYNEWNILIDKPINLIGENRDTTTIDGNYQGNVVVIQSDYVTVNGFKIINCVMENQTKYVIHVSDSKNVVIKDNYISVGKNFPIYGIFGIGIFIYNSPYNLIQNNIIFKEGEQCVTKGIEVKYHSNYNNFSGNEIYRYNSGIETEDSDNNEFYANNIHHTDFGMVIHGVNNNIINNKINDNELIGIILGTCRNILVYRNTITNNDGDGIMISDCKSFNIINNNISNNEPRGIYIHNEAFSSSGNIISKNNLISNGKNAAFFSFYFFPLSVARWDNNYWGRAYILPKIIFGYTFIIFPGYYGLPFPLINIDWNPANEPYDI